MKIYMLSLITKIVTVVKFGIDGFHFSGSGVMVIDNFEKKITKSNDRQVRKSRKSLQKTKQKKQFVGNLIACLMFFS